LAPLITVSSMPVATKKEERGVSEPVPGQSLLPSAEIRLKSSTLHTLHDRSHRAQEDGRVERLGLAVRVLLWDGRPGRSAESPRALPQTTRTFSMRMMALSSSVSCGSCSKLSRSRAMRAALKTSSRMSSRPVRSTHSSTSRSSWSSVLPLRGREPEEACKGQRACRGRDETRSGDERERAAREGVAQERVDLLLLLNVGDIPDDSF